jgi:hypothetical protein
MPGWEIQTTGSALIFDLNLYFEKTIESEKKAGGFKVQYPRSHPGYPVDDFSTPEWVETVLYGFILNLQMC